MRYFYLSLFICITTFSCAQNTEKINWLTIEDAEKLNEKTPKRWLIDISTEWCGWCKKMDKVTFQDPIIAKYVNKNFYAVKLDGEEQREITFDGVEYNFIGGKRDGYHELPATLMNGEMSYPTVVFLSKNKEILTPISGFISKENFHQIISFINEYDLENPISPEEFNKKYTSPY